MKLNKQVVKWFEREQREWGTATAIFNLLWIKAADDLEAIGVRRVRTTQKTKK